MGIYAGVGDPRENIRNACANELCEIFNDLKAVTVPQKILVDSIVNILIPTVIKLSTVAKQDHQSTNSSASLDFCFWEQTLDHHGTGLISLAQSPIISTGKDVLCPLLECLTSQVLLRLGTLLRYPTFDKLWIAIVSSLVDIAGNSNDDLVMSKAKEVLRILVNELNTAGIFDSKQGLKYITIDFISQLQNNGELIILLT